MWKRAVNSWGLSLTKGKHYSANRITNETIMSVTPQGTCVIYPNIEVVVQSALFQGKPGDIVQVWNDAAGRPRMILNTTVRRGAAPAPPLSEFPVLEEVFVATDSEGRRDIFYRNENQIQPLGVHEQSTNGTAIPAAETIVDVRFLDAYPTSEDALADPDVRTLILVRTVSGAFTTDPGALGTRAVKFYVLRLPGKTTDLAQSALVGEAELVRVESTATMTGLTLIDWDFNRTQQQAPLRINRWRADTTSGEEDDPDTEDVDESTPDVYEVTDLGATDYALSPNVAHAHRTVTMAQAIPGLVGAGFDEVVQGHVRDAWLDPQSGHTIVALTLEFGVLYPSFVDGVGGDTSSLFTRDFDDDEAGTVGAEVEGGFFDIGINVAPEAHGLVVDVTSGVVLWTSAGTVARTFTKTDTVTGYTTLYGHIASYTDGVFSDPATVFGTPPVSDLAAANPVTFEDVQSGVVATGAVQQEDAFPDDALFSHAAMYLTTNFGSTTTKASRSCLTGDSDNPVNGKLALEVTVTTTRKDRVRRGHFADLRMLRWRTAAADRRMWAVLSDAAHVGSHSVSFSTETVKPAILDGAGALLGSQPYRRAYVRPTGAGSFQYGFLRLLSASQQHVMFRWLGGVSDASNAPADGVFLTNIDSGVAVTVINFPLVEVAGEGAVAPSTGTVTWEVVDGDFSQVESALDFFRVQVVPPPTAPPRPARLIRLVSRDFALATLEELTRMFVQAWDPETLAPLLNAAAVGFPIEDEDMTALKKMKELPDDIVSLADPQASEIVTPLTDTFGGLMFDTNSIQIYHSDWRVINDKAALRGRWEEE